MHRLAPKGPSENKLIGQPSDSLVKSHLLNGHSLIGN